MQTVSLSVDLINRILNYLSRHPYAEVAVMITEIQKSAIPLPAIGPVPAATKSRAINGPEVEVARD